MRLRIFGIPKISLIFLGMLPAILWCGFHHSQPLAWGFGALFALIFTLFFSRGFFGIRFGVLFFSSLVMAEAFFSAMVERDFLKLSIAFVIFILGILLFFWLENRVHSADLNPKLDWYEGEPKFLPQLKARLKVKSDWQEGSIRTIDHHGFFVFLPDPKVTLPKRGVEFILEFKNTSVEGTAKIKRAVFW